jgi:hypothetical protein
MAVPRDSRTRQVQLNWCHHTNLSVLSQAVCLEGAVCHTGTQNSHLRVMTVLRNSTATVQSETVNWARRQMALLLLFLSLYYTQCNNHKICYLGPLITHWKPTFWPFMAGLTKKDETRQLLSHLPPLSCYYAHHPQFSQVPLLTDYSWLFIWCRASDCPSII